MIEVNQISFNSSQKPTTTKETQDRQNPRMKQVSIDHGNLKTSLSGLPGKDIERFDLSFEQRLVLMNKIEDEDKGETSL